MEGRMSKETRDNFIWTILLMAVAVYGIACFSLHLNQIVKAEGLYFESDLPAHISMTLEDGWFYSLMGLLIKLFYAIGAGAYLTAGFIAVCEAGAIFATLLLVNELTDKYYTKSMGLMFALMANLIMPFYLELAGKQRYIGYQSASVWHNSTYTLVKLLGIITLWYFLKLRDKYLDGLKVSEWLIFAGLLILCNAAKPSFCFVFDFAMLVILIFDLCKKDERDRLERFKRIVIFGCSVLPSLIVIWWQNNVLFGQETGNGITINPGYALAMRGDHPKVTFILSIAFPLFILVWNFGDLKWDKRLRFMWLMWLFSFLEVFLLAEEGARALDSNFFWGYSIGIFFVNLISMIKLIENMKRKEGIYESSILRAVITSCGTLILAYQVYCGIYFFINLVMGTTYWM